MDSETEVVKEKIDTDPVLNDPRYITLLTLIVAIFTFIFWWCYTRRQSQRRSILFTGLSDAGKTLIFVRLAFSYYRQTFTSMKENVEEYVTSHNMFKIVDLPGQERLRKKFFDQYKSSARAIVYVIDSVTIQKEIRDVAEYLYTILVDPVVQKNSPPLVILCNKQDQPMAKGSQIIKGLLEKELNLVRITKSSQLQSVDPNQSNNSTYLGKLGRDFEFSHLSCSVDFIESTANNGDDNSPTDLVELEEWINGL